MKPYLLPSFLLLLGTAGALYERRASRRDAFTRFHPPGQRVDLGGFRLYSLATGRRAPGQPLVILEAGHADWSKCWAAVQPQVASFARVLSYDRAGSGWSDAGPQPRTPEQMVLELHELLARCGESPPYIMVGHSMGGPLSRLYHQLYPGEVAGMVWVDTAHEYMQRFLPFWWYTLPSFLLALQAGRGLAHLGVLRVVSRRALLAAYPSVTERQAQAVLLAQMRGAGFFDWVYQETVGFTRPHSWNGNPRSLDSLPVISLEAQYTPAPQFGIPRHQWQQFLAGWSAMHADLDRLSTRTQRLPVNAGHALMHETPQLVVEAVRELAERVTLTRNARPPSRPVGNPTD